MLPLAFLIIVNDKVLGMEAITPWPVLGAAVLGSIGLKFLFPGFGRKHGHRKKRERTMIRGRRSTPVKMAESSIKIPSEIPPNMSRG